MFLKTNWLRISQFDYFFQCGKDYEKFKEILEYGPASETPGLGWRNEFISHRA